MRNCEHWQDKPRTVGSRQTGLQGKLLPEAADERVANPSLLQLLARGRPPGGCEDIRFLLSLRNAEGLPFEPGNGRWQIMSIHIKGDMVNLQKPVARRLGSQLSMRRVECGAVQYLSSAMQTYASH